MHAAAVQVERRAVREYNYLAVAVEQNITHPRKLWGTTGTIITKQDPPTA